MFFRHITIQQVHARDPTCGKVFDFALVFTVHSLERFTTCETVTNQPLTMLLHPPCGRMLISTTIGNFTHVMQLGNVGKYIAELKQKGECGPLDKMVLLLANTMYDSNSFAGYRMNLYILQLQYLSELHGVFELRSDAVLFYFNIYSNCLVDLYYSKVIRRNPKTRIHTFNNNTVSSK